MEGQLDIGERAEKDASLRSILCFVVVYFTRHHQRRRNNNDKSCKRLGLLGLGLLDSLRRGFGSDAWNALGPFIFLFSFFFLFSPLVLVEKTCFTFADIITE